MDLFSKYTNNFKITHFKCENKFEIQDVYLNSHFVRLSFRLFPKVFIGCLDVFDMLTDTQAVTRVITERTNGILRLR